MEEGIDEIKDYTASKEEDDEYDIIVDPTQSDEEEATASSSCKVQLLIELLDVFGTVVFAFSGALKAGNKGMDIVGMMLIASVTAIGGGTLRDILMMGGGEEYVVFWMKKPIYLEISLITALATFYVWPKLKTKFGLEDDSAVIICTSGK